MTTPAAHKTTALKTARLAARAALLWEQLWPALLPLLAVVATFLAISWLGLWPLFSETARWGTLGALALAGLAALLPLRHIRMPKPSEVDRRIEQHSALAHRPVTARTDSLAGTAPDDPFAAALWREHRRRAVGQLQRLSAGLPRPALAKRDPYALRALIPLVLFIAALAGYGQYGARMADAFRNHTLAEAVASGRIDAWATPPAYTNRPPVYFDLAAEGPIIRSVPEGSVLTVRALGVSAPKLLRDEEGLTREITPQEGAVPTFETIPEAGRTLTLRSGTTDIATFALDIIPDTPPTIAFEQKPETSARGALEFSYKLGDDYGVTAAHAELKSLEVAHETATPLVDAPEIPLSLPRRRSKQGTSRISRDLTAHPWAGGRVSMTLVASDDAQQTGRSETVDFTLPARIFTNPLAEAIVFERRRLAQDINNRHSVASMLNIITTTHPHELIPDPSHYMALRVIYRMISRNEDAPTLREALDLMWTTALAIEDGDLSAAEARLRDAQERLSEALEKGASEEAIEELMAELREAMDDFMRELAQKQARQSENRQAMQDPNARMLRKQDLDSMMQRIEDLAKSGSPDAARQLLQDMQRMMNNLQTAAPQNRPPQQNPLTEQMNKLGEMMHKQQELLDQTFDMQRQQQRRNLQQWQQQQGQQQEQQQGQQQQGQQHPMTGEEMARALEQLQEQQGELQQQMEQMQQAMRDMGMELSDEMGEAGEAMGGAEKRLGEGNTGEATGEQSRALQAMRQGAQQMMQQLMQQQANRQGSGQKQGADQARENTGRDPLGRQPGNKGPQLGEDVKVPDEIDAQRAREILEAIRRRMGERNRPKTELDYLERLLPAR